VGLEGWALASVLHALVAPVEQAMQLRLIAAAADRSCVSVDYIIAATWCARRRKNLFNPQRPPRNAKETY